jgi:light-regulated signal transduction histidine kinase (bacteriophytochrome)
MVVRKLTAQAELPDFLDRLIHDMREPLRSIGVFAELLGEIAGERLGEEGDHALKEIPAGAAKIGKLLEGLSGYALALREPSEGGPASLESAFRIVLGELDDEIRACHATVTAGKLPRVSPSLDRLMQLLRNVIGNSLRFRAETAPVIRVSAAMEVPGVWTIRVEDNGIGMAAEDCEAVFRPFMRVEGRKYGGVGLGLTAAKAIVDAHEGTIRMEPLAEGGTACVFTLPEALE